MKKLLTTTVDETMQRYEDKVAKYAIIDAPIPLWKRILRKLFRV